MRERKLWLVYKINKFIKKIRAPTQWDRLIFLNFLKDVPNHMPRGKYEVKFIIAKFKPL